MARNKYGNKKVREDGYTFDSKAEHRRYLELKLLVKAGEITRLKVHPRYCLQTAFTDVEGKRWQAIFYEGDFEYIDTHTGQTCCDDTKGVVTQVFSIKAKLFRKLYPHIKFRILYV